jgi:hypothetical protein
MCAGLKGFIGTEGLGRGFKSLFERSGSGKLRRCLMKGEKGSPRHPHLIYSWRRSSATIRESCLVTFFLERSLLVSSGFEAVELELLLSTHQPTEYGSCHVLFMVLIAGYLQRVILGSS